MVEYARMDINIMRRRRKKFLSIAKTRRSLYRGASILGDLQSIRKGPKAILKRAIRKRAGRGLGHGLKRLLK